jgi:hypothetical protein
MCRRWVLYVCMLAQGCSYEPTAGVRVDHIGSPVPIEISVDVGVCGKLETTQHQKGQITYTNCGVPPGKRRFRVRCSSEKPDATLLLDLTAGDSHYVVFKGVCSSTRVQIEQENGRPKGRLAVWENTRKN